jgi:hypothetical protein
MADDPKSFGTSPGGGFSRFSLALAQSGISSPRLSLPKISSSWTSAQRAGGSFYGLPKRFLCLGFFFAATKWLFGHSGSRRAFDVKVVKTAQTTFSD